MVPRPASALLRWVHLKSSADYRELPENLGARGKVRRAWRSVPGLIVEDTSDTSSDSLFDKTDSAEAASFAETREGRNTSLERLRMNPYRSRCPQASAKQGRQLYATKANDSVSIQTIETEDESEQEEQPRPAKAVRWADGEGEDLAITHSYDSLPYLTTRIVILLLDLNQRVFEFVQCEFSTDDRLTVLDLLRQLSSFASLDRLTQQRFRILCRPNEEMINMLSIQHYNVCEGEILIASSAEAAPKDVMAAASNLLRQKKLIRAVRKAKLSGRALQRLLSSEELLYGCERANQEVNLDPSHSDDSDDDMDDEDEYREEEEDSNLIVKVLSKLEESNFADFSFPSFDVDSDILLHSGTLDGENDNESWFEQMFTDTKEPLHQHGFAFSSEMSLPEDDDSLLALGGRSSPMGTSERVKECRRSGGTKDSASPTGVSAVVDAFESNSHDWSEHDATVPDFSSHEHMFP